MRNSILGTYHFVFIRLSAYIMILFSGYLLYWTMQVDQVDFFSLRELFTHGVFQTLFLFFMLSIFAHACIGFWQIVTDYIHCISLRSVLLTLFVLTLFGHFCYLLNIIWGL